MIQRTRVLIADDQAPTREGLRALLSLSPQLEMVGEATNGQQTVDLVAACRPDVVVMDVRMPVMDGIEASRRIKGRWPEVRVIALTLDASYESSALEAGADQFLIKGGPSQELRNAILTGGQ
jgi:DNA-binding NarL/FixJ family response regulator